MLRLIDKKTVSDSILNYDFQNKKIISVTENLKDRNQNVSNRIFPLMEYRILRDTSYFAR